MHYGVVAQSPPHTCIQDPAQVDKLTKIQRDLDDTKVVLHQTIESVLERGTVAVGGCFDSTELIKRKFVQCFGPSVIPSPHPYSVLHSNL